MSQSDAVTARRLKKILAACGLSESACPIELQQWSKLLGLVSLHFRELEARVELVENTLAISTDEMEKLYADQKVSSINEKETVIQRFKTLFDSSPMPYMFFGESGIVDCNRAGIEVLGGSSKSEILSKHPAEFSPVYQPDGRTSKEKSVEMDRLATENGFHRFEWTHQSLQGKEFPVEVSMAPVKLDNQSAMLVIWRDLTESKHKDQLLMHSSKMSSLGEMAGGVAHEINNPLGIIQGVAELLLKKIETGRTSTEDVRKQIEKITSMTDRIAKIVRGMKSFSRNAEKDPFAPVDIKSMLTNVLSLCGEKFKISEISLEIVGETEDIVECRNTQIEQVLLNLIANSMDAVRGEAEKWVRIEVQSLSDHVQLSVTDSGPGLPAFVVDKMMQPFFTTKTVGKGTGLGLSISKGIVEDHCGQLFFDRSSKQTRFVMILPRKQDPKSPLQKVS